MGISSFTSFIYVKTFSPFSFLHLLFVCLDIFRVCTFILGIGFVCQDESCPPSFSHPYKHTSRTEISLMSSEQEGILLVACNLFFLIELLSQVYSEQELLLTPLLYRWVWFQFVFLSNPMEITFTRFTLLL